MRGVIIAVGVVGTTASSGVYTVSERGHHRQEAKHHNHHHHHKASFQERMSDLHALQNRQKFDTPSSSSEIAGEFSDDFREARDGMEQNDDEFQADYSDYKSNNPFRARELNNLMAVAVEPTWGDLDDDGPPMENLHDDFPPMENLEPVSVQYDMGEVEHRMSLHKATHPDQPHGGRQHAQRDVEDTSVHSHRYENNRHPQHEAQKPKAKQLSDHPKRDNSDNLAAGGDLLDEHQPQKEQEQQQHHDEPPQQKAQEQFLSNAEAATSNGAPVTCAPGPVPKIITEARKSVLGLGSDALVSAYTPFMSGGAVVLDAARTAKIHSITHRIAVEDGIVFDSAESCRNFQASIYPYTLTPPEGGVQAFERKLAAAVFPKISGWDITFDDIHEPPSCHQEMSTDNTNTSGFMMTVPYRMKYTKSSLPLNPAVALPNISHMMNDCQAHWKGSLSSELVAEARQDCCAKYRRTMLEWMSNMFGKSQSIFFF